MILLLGGASSNTCRALGDAGRGQGTIGLRGSLSASIAPLAPLPWRLLAPPPPSYAPRARSHFPIATSKDPGDRLRLSHTIWAVHLVQDSSSQSCCFEDPTRRRRRRSQPASGTHSPPPRAAGMGTNSRGGRGGGVLGCKID